MAKKYEEHCNFSIEQILKYFENKEVVGEITLVIKGINKKDSELNKYLLKKELHELINAGLSLSAASKFLAKKTNIPKSEIYKLY